MRLHGLYVDAISPSPRRPPGQERTGEDVNIIKELQDVRDGKWGDLSLTTITKLNEIVLYLASVRDDLERRCQKMPPWLTNAKDEAKDA
jgi:hypothetical protein